MGIYGYANGKNKHTKDIAGNSLFRGDVEFVLKQDDPNTSDINYKIPTIWINDLTNEAWILTDVTNNIATWISLGGSFVSSVIESEENVPMNLFFSGTDLVELSDHIIGSYFSRVINKAAIGPAATFAESKSTCTIDANLVRIGSCPETLNTLTTTWNVGEEIEVNKTLTTFDGTYNVHTLSSTTGEHEDVTLSGTTWATINLTAIKGNFYLEVIPENEGGPVASFLLTRNNATQTASIVKISSSPGSTGENLDVRWNTSSFVQVQKTGSGFDGTYQIMSLLVSKAQFIDSFTLTGTSTTIISSKQQRIANIISIVPRVSNAPSAIFSLCKTRRGISEHTVRLVSFPGTTSLEQLSLTWNVNEKLKLSKSGSSYDGLYDVYIM